MEHIPCPTDCLQWAATFCISCESLSAHSFYSLSVEILKLPLLLFSLFFAYVSQSILPLNLWSEEWHNIIFFFLLCYSSPRNSTQLELKRYIFEGYLWVSLRGHSQLMFPAAIIGVPPAKWEEQTLGFDSGSLHSGVSWGHIMPWRWECQVSKIKEKNDFSEGRLWVKIIAIYNSSRMQVTWDWPSLLPQMPTLQICRGSAELSMFTERQVY